jgi:tRNA threonylcarbamoyladenosine biosynthesis protein TsaB
LLDDEALRCERPLSDGQRTTATFAVELRRALTEVGWRPGDVELFAVCEGPGSFTGLRIGITAAKAFAYATGCQLVALNTLEVVAIQAARKGQPIWAVLDAQRQELFVAQYELHATDLQCLSPTRLVAARQWLAELPVGTTVTGSGLRRWTTAIPDGVQMTPPSRWEPQAHSLGRLAVRRAALGQTVDLWKLVPRYYRPSAAEEKHRPSP